VKVSSGDFVSLKPAHVLTHDNTAPVIGKFRQMNGKKMADPSAPPAPPAITGCADQR
jgi:homoaconitate hydratase